MSSLEENACLGTISGQDEIMNDSDKVAPAIWVNTCLTCTCTNDEEMSEESTEEAEQTVDAQDTTNECETETNEDDNNLSLDIATTKNPLEISADMDDSLLNRTLEIFCDNLRHTVQSQFLTSRERLFRQTEKEIDSISNAYQHSLHDKDSTLAQMSGDYDALKTQHVELQSQYADLQHSHHELSKNFLCVRQLSQTMTRWKTSCEKKKFVANYITRKIIPNKKTMRLERLYYFWKNRAMSARFKRYDEIWEKRLETVSKKIIEQYELNIHQLREELNDKNCQLQKVHHEQKEQQQHMKRAFMKGISALNLEAMSLFQDEQQGMTNSGDHDHSCS